MGDCELPIDQMEFAAELVVHRDDGAVDVADQAVAEDDVRDLPVAAALCMRQRRQGNDARGLAAGLTAQRLVRDRGELKPGLANGRHQVCSDERMRRTRGGEPASLMAAVLELAGAGLGQAEHATGGIDPGDGAFAEPVIEAIGIAILHP